MRERDIHKLIEQQDTEAKQRIWEKVCAQIDFDATQPQQATAAKTVTKNNPWKWITATVAVVVVVVTLSIVLPLTLKDNDNGGTRFCDYESYIVEGLDQPLGEYFSAHNESLLFIDWYDVAEEINTVYGYNKNDKKDVIYFTENILNTETGETIQLSITDSRTKVDIFAEYYNGNTEEQSTVKGISIQWQSMFSRTLATFEYQHHIYYLELRGGNQARLTEIIEGMLQ